MTTEEAIEILSDVGDINRCCAEDAEALDMAIKALEQQPCEDCISRQRVLDIINFEYKWLLDAKVYDICTSIAFSAIMSKISEMPSVTPTRPTGRWILLDECSNSGYYCSECHKKVIKEGWSNTVKKVKYCPNCGARMAESEVKADADSN